MTYQQLIEEFDSKRQLNLTMPTDIRVVMDSDNLQCTLREMLIKLRNGDKG